jgi:hypothetical protein
MISEIEIQDTPYIRILLPVLERCEIISCKVNINIFKCKLREDERSLPVLHGNTYDDIA